MDSTVGFDGRQVDTTFLAAPLQPEEQLPVYAFGNPAGCSATPPTALSLDEMLARVQEDLGASYNIAENRSIYIWNGPLNTMLDVSSDKFVVELTIDDYQPPLTYKADQLATVFLNNGFVAWFRFYDGHFRLLAVPMTPGVSEFAWGDYIKAYWQVDGLPADNWVQPTTKKLPCHWVIDAGWVTDEQLLQQFNLDWNMPDYLTAGRKFLAATCEEANQVAQQKIGYWDAYSMCGPLAWTIVRDANSFPYRMGNWYADAQFVHPGKPALE